MNEDFYRNKILLDGLTLGDLWEMGLLEGMMKFGDCNRTTAGLKSDFVEFHCADGIIKMFNKSTPTRINTGFMPDWAVDFNNNTLVLARKPDRFLGKTP